MDFIIEPSSIQGLDIVIIMSIQIGTYISNITQ